MPILLQVEHQLALVGQGAERTRFVVFENGFDHLFRLVDQLDQIHVFRIDQSFLDQTLLEPVDQALPEWRTDQNQRDLARLASLDQGQRTT